MFVDAAAIVAILSSEQEQQRCSTALADAPQPFTSAIAVWESVLALARPDKFGSIELAEEAVGRLIERRGIELRQLPPATEAMSLSLSAAKRYRNLRRPWLNIADCFHYACAKHYGTPMLSTADEFRFTDLVVVP